MSAQFRNPQARVVREIAVFDGRVRDSERLVRGLRSDVAAMRLSGTGDGLGEMLAYLGGRGGVETLHIVCHGAPGRIVLGDRVITAASLPRLGRLVTALAQALAPHAVIRLYGCHAGAGVEGRALVATLAAMTGASVVASETLTGAAELGGDWDLAVQSGPRAGHGAFDDTGGYRDVLVDATTKDSGFKTTDGTKLDDNSMPGNMPPPFGTDPDTLTIADPAHLSGSVADGQDGDDAILFVASTDPLDLKNLDTLANFETLISTADITTLKSADLDQFGRINTGGGFDTLELTGGGTADFSMITLQSVELIQGDDGAADTITGTANSDRIAGRGGADDLSGGDGDDTFRLNNGDYVMGETIDGGAGSDTLKIVDTSNPVTLDLTTGTAGDLSDIEILEIDSNQAHDITLGGIDDSDGNPVAAFTVRASTGLSSDITLDASALDADADTDNAEHLVFKAPGFNGNDTVTGSAGADTIATNNGNDTINGGAGDDTLTGGAGADDLSGGAGADIFAGTKGALNGDTLTDLKIGDTVRVTGVTGLSADNVRFDSGNLEIDTDATDFGGIEVAMPLSTTPSGVEFRVTDDGSDTDIELAPDAAPSLVSITRAMATDKFTKADSLEFTATFSEPVVNVGANDFTVTKTTMPMIGVNKIDDQTFTLTVSGGDLAGLNAAGVGLDLDTMNQDIADLAGQDLPDAEPGTDETFTVDNTAPTVADDTFEVGEDAGAVSLGDIHDNDSDNFSAAADLTVTKVGGDKDGLFTINADGTVTFDPNGDFDDLSAGDTQATTVPVTSADEAGNTAMSDITVTVTGANDLPTASDENLTVTEDKAADFDLGAAPLDAVADADGDDLTVALSDTPDNGDASAMGTTVKFTPDADFNGSDSFHLHRHRRQRRLCQRHGQRHRDPGERRPGGQGRQPECPGGSDHEPGRARQRHRRRWRPADGDAEQHPSRRQRQRHRRRQHRLHPG